MKTLLIDNFDSFTYNLYQLLAEVNRIPPVVIKNNSREWPQLKNADFDNIVISPGPGRPDQPADFGICAQVIQEADIPILGVCLGHQGLCQLLGGDIAYAERVMHGRLSKVNHRGDALFANIPSPFEVVRYHSLYVSRVPECMQAIAETDDGINMAVRHRQKPIWGVQFHPESICTQYGRKLLENFRDLSRAALQGRSAKNTVQKVLPPVPGSAGNRQSEKPLKIFHRRLALTPAPEQVFRQCFAQAENSFWLDGDCFRQGQGRYSYMGDSTGPHAARVCYRQAGQQLSVYRNGEQQKLSKALFDFLPETLQLHAQNNEDLPFDFNLGWVGYLGYEMKGDCGYTAPHTASTADANMVFADRMLVFDHTEQVVYLVCLEYQENKARAQSWMHSLSETLASLAATATASTGRREEKAHSQFQARHSEAEYLALIAQAKAAIRRGESYEVCLTNQLSAQVDMNPLDIYCELRRTNPAPYASYLKFDELEIVSCSPERFLSIDRNGRVETKPIKGTRKRSRDPQQDEHIRNELYNSEKDRAENLMIVDLLRNDLGQVSEVGSVHVSKLFDIESFATVHQMVSTVNSRLRRNVTAIDCVQACFPGGSMTGAPKKRTLEILDQLEGSARGVYSGSIGFFALNGSADFSIVIRTLVFRQGTVSLGVGGAIVDLSVPQQEWQETRVKAQALLDVFQSGAAD